MRQVGQRKGLAIERDARRKRQGNAGRLLLNNDSKVDKKEFTKVQWRLLKNTVKARYRNRR